MTGAQEILIRNARLVLSDQVIDAGHIVLRDRRIADLGHGPGGAGTGLDFEGDLVMPGLIELHTDNLERHLMPRPGVFWPSFAALCAHDAQIATAGITTVFDAVSLGERDGREERHAFLDDAMSAIAQSITADTLRVDHFVHLRCEVPKPHVCELFDHYAPLGRVRLVSLMDHTPGDRQFPDVVKLKESSVNHYGEDPDEFDRRIAQDLENQTRYAAANRRTIAGQAQARGFVLASHDDAKTSHIDEAAALGVTVSEFPTTLDAAQAARGAGLTTIMGGPNVIRGGSHSGNVAARDLARHDLLDALSSDYVPLSLIHAPFRLAEELGWDLPRALALVTSNPARMAGFDDRGVLEAGRRADLVRVHLGADGPMVRETWVAGQRVA